MLDLSHGNITIDGIDISRLSRDAVRECIIAITQDQFSLPGTIMQNIDPYGASTPESVIDLLSRLELWEAIQAKGGLDAEFDEDMLSHGQRQLFLLARAVLRKGRGRVVLLDEAMSRYDQLRLSPT
jgi:ATP-binding cassette, subfamily C (CFTR/MRP), member 1